MSISRRRGGDAGPGRTRAVRGHVVLLFIPNPWAYRIGGRGRTRSARLARTAARARERAREPVVAPFTKKLARGEDRSRRRVRRRAPESPALGDCHFRSRDREMDFVHSTLRLIRCKKICFFNISIHRCIQLSCIVRRTSTNLALPQIAFFVFFPPPQKEIQRPPRYYRLGFKNIGFGIFTVI